MFRDRKCDNSTGKLKVLSGIECIITLPNSRTVLIEPNLKTADFILNSKTMNQKETGISSEVQPPFLSPPKRSFSHQCFIMMFPKSKCFVFEIKQLITCIFESPFSLFPLSVYYSV